MTYRNPALLRSIKDCPHCMLCGEVNHGQVVAAHSNQGRDGKGMGHKAADYRIAALCFDCHREIDQGNQKREERVALFERAHRATVGWLFESGVVGTGREYPDKGDREAEG